MASISTGGSYLLVILAPFLSTLLALRWFADGDRQPQPMIRLSRLGSWRKVRRYEAVRHPLYGASGIMASLLIGMMLNVPVRAAEYFAAMPPLPTMTPSWLSALHLAMPREPSRTEPQPTASRATLRALPTTTAISR